MNAFRVDPAAHVPPSIQIVEAILDQVATGAFAAGDRLPSVRTLAVDVLVNPNTAAKAYTELERLGVVAARNGSGVYVTNDGLARAIELRHAATLAAFVDAALGALRAGHSSEVLGELLAKAAENGNPGRGQKVSR